MEGRAGERRSGRLRAGSPLRELATPAANRMLCHHVKGRLQSLGGWGGGQGQKKGDGQMRHGSHPEK